MASLVVVAAGYLLVAVLTNAIVDANLRTAEAEARDTVVRRVLFALKPEDMDTPLHGERLAEFDRFVRESVVSARTARIKIWAPDGRVVYADDPAIIGQQFPLDEDLQRALLGATSSDRTTSSSGEHQSEAHLGTLLEVYTPLVFPGAAQPAGAFEIYQVYEPVAHQVAIMRRYVLLTLGGGLAVLYVALLVMAHGVGLLGRQNLRLAVSEGRFKDMVDSTDGIVWEANASTFDFTFISKKAERLLGYRVEDWLKPGFWVENLHPDDRVWAPEYRASRTGRLEPHDFEYRFIARDGRTVWLHDFVTVVAEDGAPRWLRGIMVDITEHKLAEDALRESEARFRTLFDSATDGIFLLSPDSELVSVNESFARMHGYRVDEMRAFSLKDLDTPASALLAPERMRRLVAGEALTFEVEHYHRDGHVFPLEVSGSLVSFGGKPLIQCAHRDITDRKRAEEALRESEYFFKESQRAAFIGSYTCDFVADRWESSEVLNQIFGIDQDYDRSVQSWLELTHPDDIEMMGRYLAEEVIAKRTPFNKDYRIIRKSDGHTRWVTGLGEIAFDAEGNVVSMIGTIQDITDRKRAEEALRESEARFRAVVDTVPAAIRIYDGDRMVFANDTNTALTGYSNEEILAPGWGRRLVHPEDVPLLADREARRLLGEPREPRYASRIVRKDGQVCWVVSDAVPITFDGRPARLVISTDITERKEAEEERRQLDLQVQHAQKLESLGVLAGGIAHDFNNLLVAVLGNASLALMELSPESPARETIESIEVAARRAADLTAQMLAYSGKGHFLVGPINLPQLVEEMGHLLEVAISKQATLAYHFAPDTPLIEADATQIRQVVMNLITNASEAIGDAAGVIAIGTGMLYADRAYLSGTYLDNDLPEGDYAFVEVTDTGSGMDEATRLRIFDPFFTTKFTGRGLGLAAVLGIVRGHHGAIKISSEVGRGTTFRVLFPVAEPSTAIAPAPATKLTAEPAPSNATILVVDDDATVRTVTRRILERFGYIVIAARDGNEALALFQEQTPFPDLVLLDLTMPGMDGRATFRELRRIDPTARIVLMSGYGEADATEQFSGEDLAGFIQKPFQMSDLLTALTNALD